MLCKMRPAFPHIVCDSVRISYIALGIKAIRRDIERKSPLPVMRFTKIAKAVVIDIPRSSQSSSILRLSSASILKFTLTESKEGYEALLPYTSGQEFQFV